MNRERTVHKLSTIIDLLNHDTAHLTGKHSVRIRYDYDGLKKSQEFTLLNKDIPKESADKIIHWLNDNVKSEDIIYGMESNRLDVESYKKCA